MEEMMQDPPPDPQSILINSYADSQWNIPTLNPQRPCRPRKKDAVIVSLIRFMMSLISDCQAVRDSGETAADFINKKREQQERNAANRLKNPSKIKREQYAKKDVTPSTEPFYQQLYAAYVENNKSSQLDKALIVHNATKPLHYRVNRERKPARYIVEECTDVRAVRNFYIHYVRLLNEGDESSGERLAAFLRIPSAPNLYEDWLQRYAREDDDFYADRFLAHPS